MEGVIDLLAVMDKVSTAAFDDASVAELLDVQTALERVFRRIPAVQHRVMAAVKAQAGPADLGARSWRDALGIRLRLSPQEAGRRLAEGELLAPRRTVTGERLAPVYPGTSAAQARGEITAEHVRIITTTMKKIPFQVDEPTRADAEARLAGYASVHDPDTLRRLAKHLLAVLDPDGPEPHDEEDDQRTEERRTFVLGPQDEHGNSEFRGTLTAQGRAYLEPVMGKLAAPGMCNPADESACTKGTPSQEAIDADTRSLGQRQHDALITIARGALASGELGEHNGLPVTVVVSTTVTELEAAAGVAHTGGGSRLPMCDLIRMAGHARHYLSIFDEHTAVPLYLGRTKRIASAGQRLVLHARDRGCTYPGCRVPAYGCQAHHATRAYAQGGNTDIDELVLACGPHNRLVKDGSWTTVITTSGHVEWIPPPPLDTGQARTNLYHHPEHILGGEVPRPPRPQRPPDG